MNVIKKHAKLPTYQSISRLHPYLSDPLNTEQHQYKFESTVIKGFQEREDKHFQICEPRLICFLSAIQKSM